MWNLDGLITGGVSGVVVAAVFRFIDIMMNKKVRSPADISSQRRADIVERNEIIEAERQATAAVRADLAIVKGERDTARREADQNEANFEQAQRENMALEHYIYKCLGTFEKLGLQEHIPKPTPFERRIIEKNKDNNG